MEGHEPGMQCSGNVQALTCVSSGSDSVSETQVILPKGGRTKVSAVPNAVGGGRGSSELNASTVRLAHERNPTSPVSAPHRSGRCAVLPSR